MHGPLLPGVMDRHAVADKGLIPKHPSLRRESTMHLAPVISTDPCWGPPCCPLPRVPLCVTPSRGWGKGGRWRRVSVTPTEIAPMSMCHSSPSSTALP